MVSGQITAISHKPVQNTKVFGRISAFSQKPVQITEFSSFFQRIKDVLSI